jgi:hypothetical protein
VTPPPPRPSTTLHLRCGDDLRERLPHAGIAGEYLCFADPVCQGPARDDGDLAGWLARRARFVAAHAGADEAEVRRRLEREYAALRGGDGDGGGGGLGRHDAVWLWFEHDLWDQAALIRVLSLLAGQRALEGKLWLVPADGVRAFPELADAELAALRPAPLSPQQVRDGAEAWAAFAAPDPRALDALSRRRRPLSLPFLAAALRRHLRDLPWTTDGLAETERRALRAVAGGARDETAVLRAFRAADPVFHPTDLILRDVLRRLRAGPEPLLAPTDPLALTDRGRAVLAGRERHRPAAPRVLGGVEIGPHTLWRWDVECDGVSLEPRAG